MIAASSIMIALKVISLYRMPSCSSKSSNANMNLNENLTYCCLNAYLDYIIYGNYVISFLMGRAAFSPLYYKGLNKAWAGS